MNANTSFPGWSRSYEWTSWYPWQYNYEWCDEFMNPHLHDQLDNSVLLSKYWRAASTDEVRPMEPRRDACAVDQIYQICNSPRMLRTQHIAAINVGWPFEEVDDRWAMMASWSKTPCLQRVRLGPRSLSTPPFWKPFNDQYFISTWTWLLGAHPIRCAEHFIDYVE